MHPIKSIWYHRRLYEWINGEYIVRIVENVIKSTIVHASDFSFHHFRYPSFGERTRWLAQKFVKSNWFVNRKNSDCSEKIICCIWHNWTFATFCQNYYVFFLLLCKMIFRFTCQLLLNSCCLFQNFVIIQLFSYQNFDWNRYKSYNILLR